MDIRAEEENIRQLWEGCQNAEKHWQKRGLEFGKACYEYREKYKRPNGVRVSVSHETQDSFESLCERLHIPRPSAYRWIARYEEVVGLRKPEPTKEKEADAFETQDDVLDETTK